MPKAMSNYRWSTPEQILWLRIQVASPGPLATPGASGQYVYAFEVLSLKVRKAFVDVVHTLDNPSVLRFDNDQRTKSVDGLEVPQSREPTLFYETVTRRDGPVISNTSVLTTTSTHGTDAATIVNDGPTGFAKLSTPP